MYNNIYLFRRKYQIISYVRYYFRSKSYITPTNYSPMRWIKDIPPSATLWHIARPFKPTTVWAVSLYASSNLQQGNRSPWLRNQFYHVLRRASCKVRTCDHIPNFRINEFVRVYEKKITCSHTLVFEHVIFF